MLNKLTPDRSLLGNTGTAVHITVREESLSAMPYQTPLLIVGERKENYAPTDTERTERVKGGYFCGRCKGEVVLTPSSQQRIASRPDGNLLCVPCFRRDPVLAWKLLKKIAG